MVDIITQNKGKEGKEGKEKDKLNTTLNLLSSSPKK